MKKLFTLKGVLISSITAILGFLAIRFWLRKEKHV